MNLSNCVMSAPCCGNVDLSNRRAFVTLACLQSLNDGDDCIEMIDSDTIQTHFDDVAERPQLAQGMLMTSSPGIIIFTRLKL